MKDLNRELQLFKTAKDIAGRKTVQWAKLDRMSK